jgi:hypothetical protein
MMRAGQTDCLVSTGDTGAWETLERRHSGDPGVQADGSPMSPPDDLTPLQSNSCQQPQRNRLGSAGTPFKQSRCCDGTWGLDSESASPASHSLLRQVMHLCVPNQQTPPSKLASARSNLHRAARFSSAARPSLLGFALVCVTHDSARSQAFPICLKSRPPSHQPPETCLISRSPFAAQLSSAPSREFLIRRRTHFI